MRKRVLGLDWLRAVSMILVVLYHYTTRYQESIGHVDVWPVAVPWGCYAVNTFFILTGYLTFANLHRGGRLPEKTHCPPIPNILGEYPDYLRVHGAADAGETTEREGYSSEFHHVSWTLRRAKCGWCVLDASG